MSRTDRLVGPRPSYAGHSLRRCPGSDAIVNVDGDELPGPNGATICRECGHAVRVYRPSPLSPPRKRAHILPRPRRRRS